MNAKTQHVPAKNSGPVLMGCLREKAGHWKPACGALPDDGTTSGVTQELAL
jgi:hypothetical protein